MAVGPHVDKAGVPRLVVVVDDDEGIREVCVDALLEAGYRVDAFARGEPALVALARGEAAVLVVDWKMPGLDGVEVARRARAADPRLGVVMVTADGYQAAAAAGPAGVDRILVKPFLMDELVAAVAALAGSPTS